MTLDKKVWEVGIYQEVDGYYYYDPSSLGTGSYGSNTLREIADRLDSLNMIQSMQHQLEND